MADVVSEKQEPCNLLLNEENMKNYVLNGIESLKNQAIDHLMQKEHFSRDSIEIEVYLNLRYKGTDTGIMCSSIEDVEQVEDLKYFHFEKSFIRKYKEEYGFNLDRQIFIDDIRIRGIGKSKDKNEKPVCVEERKSGSIQSLYVSLKKNFWS